MTQETSRSGISSQKRKILSIKLLCKITGVHLALKDVGRIMEHYA